MFWGFLGLKYSRLSKFIQKIDSNARMPRIFVDSVDKSAFYIYIPMCFHVINLYDYLDAVYSST